MGKRGSDLCSFIIKGLKKYPNLKKISDNPLTFSIYFPRKTTKLDPAYEQFLKDWRELKRKPYKYSMAKQAVETALKKSDFFQKMQSTKSDTLIYQILDKDEILKKKISKGLNVKEEYQDPLSVGEYQDPLSVESSGYGSSAETRNSFASSDEEGDYKSGDDNITEQLVFDQNTEVSYLIAPPTHLLEDFDTSSENELLSVNPNDIMIDDRNNIWQHFEKMYKEEITDPVEAASGYYADCLNVDSLDPYAGCHEMDSKDPNYLPNDFSDMDFKSCEEAVDWNELMDVVLDSFQEVKEEKKEKPVMQMFHLKEVKRTDEGEVLIFSPNVVEDLREIKNESNVKDEPKIAVDDEQMGRISAAINSPLNIGFINGEIHLCLKH